jgi:NADPH2 dehydrogenase
MSAEPKLFTPAKVGTVTLAHRVVMAPLTRYRANKAHVHGPMAVQYYSQRAAVKGTLLITEATYVAAQGGGYNNAPGIYTDEQIAAWKKVCGFLLGHTISLPSYSLFSFFCWV